MAAAPKNIAELARMGAEMWGGAMPLEQRVGLLAENLLRAGLPPEFVMEVQAGGAGLLRRATGRWPAGVKAALGGLSAAQRTIFEQYHQVARHFESGISSTAIQPYVKRALATLKKSTTLPQKWKAPLTALVRTGAGKAKALTTLSQEASTGTGAHVWESVTRPTPANRMLPGAVAAAPGATGKIGQAVTGAAKGAARWAGPIGGALLGWEALSATAGSSIRARRVLDAYHRGESGVHVARAHLEDYLAARNAISQRRAMLQRDPQLLDAIVQAVGGGGGVPGQPMASAGAEGGPTARTRSGVRIGAWDDQPQGTGPTPDELDQALEELLTSLA
jgi:hypothetical protein